MKTFFEIIKKLLLAFIFFYVMLCGAVYFFSEIFIFHPSSEVPNVNEARSNGYPAELVTYKSKDGTDLFAWHTKPKENLDKKKIIIFMHGNAGNLEYFYHKLILFSKSGYGTFLPEFRGYGGLKGKLNNKNINADAIAAVEKVYELGYKNEDIIIYGMSLGAHMALSAAYTLKDNGKFDAVVLEVPFTSVPDTAHAVFPLYMPFDFLFKDRFDNAAIIPYINTRVLIMVAKEDEIIPSKLAMKLFSLAVEPKSLIVYDGVGHNDLYSVGNDIDILKWLEQK